MTQEFHSWAQTQRAEDGTETRAGTSAAAPLTGAQWASSPDARARGGHDPRPPADT